MGSQKRGLRRFAGNPACNSFEDLKRFTADRLWPYLNRVGKVFYSSFDTYQHGRVIFLGYNPGGSGGLTLADHIRTTPDGSWNHFLCERWGTKGRYNILQKRTHNLFEQLGLNPNPEVFTSNLYFQRTRTASDLTRRENGAFMKACFEVVRHFLTAVPAVLAICNGNGTFIELLKRLDSADRSRSQPFEDIAPGLFQERAKLLRTIRVVEGKELRIIGLPHLSWFPVDKQPRAIEVLREQL